VVVLEAWELVDATVVREDELPGMLELVDVVDPELSEVLGCGGPTR
jgi:hypothetical protein